MIQRSLRYKASDNHTSETNITGVYTPNAPTRHHLICYNSMFIHRELVIILKAQSQVQDNFWQLSAFKNDEKYYLFHLKSSFHFQHIKILVLTLFGYTEQQLD